MRKNSVIKLLGFAGIACAASVANGHELNVQVLGVDNKAVSDAVVYVVAADSQALSQTPSQSPSQTKMPLSASPVKMAVMDQHNKNFTPHVLAIPVGTKVDFPNTDTVNHYVYSFSDIKKFQFKLFKGDIEKHQAVFDKPGVVAMGCNIHDFMLGYIFVAPTPYVAVTDATGDAHIVLPDKGEFSLEVWYERGNEDVTKLTQKISTTSPSNAIKIRFTKPFKPQRKMSHDDDFYY